MPLHSQARSAIAKQKRLKLLMVVFCGVAAITSSAYSLSKRPAPTRKSTVVAVVQRNNLAKGAKTVVMLRRNATPHTVILVDSQATPLDLAGAFSAVNQLREKLKDSHPQNDLMLVPKPTLKSKRLTPGGERKLQKYLTALSDNRNMKRIAGVGEGRTINVVLLSPLKRQ